jgi:hypothetical protein
VPAFGRSVSNPAVSPRTASPRQEDLPAELLAWKTTVGPTTALSDAIQALSDALNASGEDAKVRRRLFLEMQRAWHPDKNPDHPESTAVFQWLQQQKTAYLTTPTGTPRGTPRGSPRETPHGSS